jgi:uncharacterized protein (TIGR03435 family)
MTRHDFVALGVSVSTACVLCVLSSLLSAAQETPAPSFEVASVKPNNSGDPRSVFFTQPGGRFTVMNASLREIVRLAYRVQSFQITGDPGWMGSDRFDITAKASTELARLELNSGGPTPEVFLMLRSLLAERFQLAAHLETKELPIYALVVARDDGKLGPQLSPSQVDCSALRAATVPRGGGMPLPPPPPEPGQRAVRPVAGMFSGLGHVAAGCTPLRQLAISLSNRVDRLVLDETGLGGPFDFTLEFTPDQASTAAPTDAPSLFTALEEQLGLKLLARRGPVDLVVIDHVEQPSPD